jgi:hypothetical protein
MHKTIHIHKSIHKTTRKRRPKICGEIISNTEGWVVMHIHGNPYERGFAHGKLLKSQLKNIEKHMDFLLEHDMKIPKMDFMKESNKVITPILRKQYPEFYEEIRGIADGSSLPIQLIIAWNSYISLYSHFREGSKQRCSAFIATGDATEKGDIVMSHNTHCDFLTGWSSNVVLYVKPHKGFSFVMQTVPGYIASSTDWFICSSGIIGCETTISNIDYKPKFGAPYFCRIREAMQYGSSFDDYDKIMSKQNAGDYACSWLFGDIYSNEIMLFELGLREKNVQRKKSGVFYGMNSAIGEKLRENETTDIDHENITTSVGARNRRFSELLNHTYKGKINVENAKRIIADHYDVYLKRDVKNGRSICNHTELNPEHCHRPPYSPYGCTDAKVVDTEMAKQMSFMGRFGSACGRLFDVKKYIQRNPIHKHWGEVLHNMSNHKWTLLYHNK